MEAGHRLANGKKDNTSNENEIGATKERGQPDMLNGAFMKSNEYILHIHQVKSPFALLVCFLSLLHPPHSAFLAAAECDGTFFRDVFPFRMIS